MEAIEPVDNQWVCGFHGKADARCVRGRWSHDRVVKWRYIEILVFVYNLAL